MSGRIADGRAYRGRFAACGYVARGGSVTVQAAGARAWFAGLATCASVHACPVCAAKIMTARGEELVKVATWHEAHGVEGGAAAMTLLTLNTRHRRGMVGLAQREPSTFAAFADAAEHERRARYARRRGREPIDRRKKPDEAWLRFQLRGLAAAWSRFVRGAPWARFAKAIGLVGFARRVEVTEGRNGWHTHLHVTLYHSAHACERLLRDPHAPREPWEPASLQPWILARWRRCVVRELGWQFRPSAQRAELTKREREAGRTVVSRAVDLRPMSADGALYLSKMGCELTDLELKRPRRGNLTPWMILDAAAKGDGWAKARWREYVDATRGHQLLTISDAIRELAGIGPEHEDQVDEEQGDHVLRLPSSVWQGEPERDELGRVVHDEREAVVWRRRALRGLPDAVTALLDLVEARPTAEEVAALLARWGVDWEPTDEDAAGLAKRRKTASEHPSEAETRPVG